MITSSLGADIVIPGVDIAAENTPVVVTERCHLVSACVQHWDTTRLSQLIEAWGEIERDVARWTMELFGCEVTDLVVVEPRDDLASLLCRFSTARDDEMVFGFDNGPLRMDPGATEMAMFVHFNVRYNSVTDQVVGQAFDCYIDFG